MEHRSRNVTLLAVVVGCGLAVPAMVGWPQASGPEQDVSTQPELPVEAELDEAEVTPPWTVPDGWWGSDEHGVAIEPPEGWTETRRQNRAYLDRVPGSPGDGNFCVIPLPNMLGLTIDQVEAENFKAFETMDGLELISSERLEVDGHTVIATDYLATHLQTGQEYHARGIVFLHGGNQVVLTLTINAELWEDQREVVAKAFDSLVLVPR